MCVFFVNVWIFGFRVIGIFFYVFDSIKFFMDFLVGIVGFVNIMFDFFYFWIFRERWIFVFNVVRYGVKVVVDVFGFVNFLV